MKLQNTILISFSVVVLTSCNQLENNNTNNGNAGSGDTTIVINNEAKSKEEVLADNALAVLNMVQDANTNKKRRDSAEIVSKKPVWVYQIGSAVDNEELLFKKYGDLKSLGNVYAFKVSRNKFIMVLDQGLTEEELQASLSNIRLKVNAIDSRVDVVNLTSYCSRKENPLRTDAIRKRKQDIEVPCYICN